jgi:hypothetical protein
MLNTWGLSGYRLNNILAGRKHRKLLYALDDADIGFQAAHSYVHQQLSLKISWQVDQLGVRSSELSNPLTHSYKLLRTYITIYKQQPPLISALRTTFSL